MADVINDHPLNANYGLTADNIADLLQGRSTASTAIFWRELIDGQMDADRMDYLQRDSLHAGVQYGHFDLKRILATVDVLPGDKGQAPRIGISEGGWHAAESLVLARYFMFTQVYFHKTRVAFDYHLREALKELLPGGRFPEPTSDGLADFEKWDDWRVLGLLAAGEGGEHGGRLVRRDHYREVFHTPESPNVEDLAKLDKVRDKLGNLIATEESAEKSWYKTGNPDIPVKSERHLRRIAPLSEYSSIVGNLRANRQVLVYAKPDQSEEARKAVEAALGGPNGKD
jgi:HD superfamily phosphohydrolase